VSHATQVSATLNWWEWLAENDAESVDASFAHAVYRNNLHGVAVRALQLTYQAVEKALGPSNFQALASQYAKFRPPLQRDLNEYGKGFYIWLMRHPQWQAINQDLPFLGSLCAFDGT
jgi:hypothetical protein